MAFVRVRQCLSVSVRVRDSRFSRTLLAFHKVLTIIVTIMAANTFGSLFRVTTWGESHGNTVGAVIDGCPPGLEISEEMIQTELDRRKPGQSRITSHRNEGDQVRILSGVFEGRTLGTPLAMEVENQEFRPKDYLAMKDVFRPSHADMTYEAKFGLRAWPGGGRSSARETIGRVAAGAVARTWLQKEFNLEIVAWVEQVRNLVTGNVALDKVSRDEVYANDVRCPDPEMAARMAEIIDRARKDCDSLGGVIKVVIRNCPAGWGEPVFDRMDALLAHAFMSIPATKGVEIGSGFNCALMTGSEHNDPFHMENGRVVTDSNHSGGIQGGISNGMPITARIAFKPTATIARPQHTVTAQGEPFVLKAKGRHDPCVLPRAVPIVEAMAALSMADLAMLQEARTPRY